MLILILCCAAPRHLPYALIAGDPHPSLSPAQCLPLFAVYPLAETNSPILNIVEILIGSATSHRHGQEAAGGPHQRP
jgi:hypothetical protein